MAFWEGLGSFWRLGVVWVSCLMRFGWTFFDLFSGGAPGAPRGLFFFALVGGFGDRSGVGPYKVFCVVAFWSVVSAL